jgi:hypothetical protein
VFQGAKIVKASHFELEYMLGRKITFFCMAQGYPRPEITWFKDGIELYAHKFFQVGGWERLKGGSDVFDLGARVAAGQRHGQKQDGDRPHDAERRGILRVPSEQQVRH